MKLSSFSSPCVQIPSLVGMFVYRDDTSRVTSMALLGRASMSLSLFNRWVVFFT